MHHGNGQPLTGVPQGLGVAVGESSAAFLQTSLETTSVLFSHLACIYVVPEKGFFTFKLCMWICTFILSESN